MDHLDFSSLSDEELVAVYGAFFAMAAADGAVDDEELVNIFARMNLQGLSDPAARIVRGYLFEPPALTDALEPLRKSSNDVRYGVLVHLMDVALADAVYAPSEQQAIQQARAMMGASEEQVDAIEAFIRDVRGIQQAGVSDADAHRRMAEAGNRLDDAGVPRKSMALSGSVAAASASGIGAAAIAGLGLTLVPGVGLAVAGGAAAYVAMRRITGRSGPPPKSEEDLAETNRIIRHLSSAIEDCRRRVTSLESLTGSSRSESERHAERARQLNRRIDCMRRLLARKRGELA
jgi:hypothetical protein